MFYAQFIGAGSGYFAGFRWEVSCQWLAFWTEFFQLAADMYFLALCVDLRVCLFNPFTNYKLNTRVYHGCAICVAYVLCAMLGVSAAARVSVCTRLCACLLRARLVSEAAVRGDFARAIMAFLVATLQEHGRPIYGSDNYLTVCWIRAQNEGALNVNPFMWGLFYVPLTIIFFVCIILLFSVRRRIRAGVPETARARLAAFRNTLRYAVMLPVTKSPWPT